MAVKAKELLPGDMLEVIADRESFPKDIKAWCEKTGKTLRRMLLLREMLAQLGINKKRLRVEWISAAECKKFVETVNEFIDEVKQLGPIKIKKGVIWEKK